ncbi:MAG: hypothetical protein OEV92_13740 [Nitrospinota bacterium]|nr:hypothetical protein [Nitrospinota bacterium]
MLIAKKSSGRLPYLLLLLVAGLAPVAALGQPAGPGEDQAAPYVPQIAASPTPLFMKIGPRPASGSLTLYNMSREDVAISATVYNFDLDENNEVRIIPPTEQSMDLWMVINPVSFTIPAGKSQTVRISVRPPVKPEPGEHRAIVIFSQQLTDAADPATVRARFQIRVGVYGVAGDAVAEGELHSLTMAPADGFAELGFDITSAGNSALRLQGQFSLWPKEKFNEAEASKTYTIVGNSRDVPADAVDAGELPGLPVLAGTRRTVKVRVRIPAQPEKYILFVHGMIGSKPFKKSFTFAEPVK